MSGLAGGRLTRAVALLCVGPVLRRPSLGFSVCDGPPVADLLGSEVAAMNLSLNGIAAHVRLDGYLGGGQHVVRVRACNLEGK